MYELVGLGTVAGNRGDVELVVSAFLAVELVHGPQLGQSVLLQDDLEGRLAVMLVGYAKRADLGVQGAYLGRNLDQGLVLLDQTVVTALQALEVQTRHRCKKKKKKKRIHVSFV